MAALCAQWHHPSQPWPLMISSIRWLESCWGWETCASLLCASVKRERKGIVILQCSRVFISPFWLWMIKSRMNMISLQGNNLRNHFHIHGMTVMMQIQSGYTPSAFSSYNLVNYFIQINVNSNKTNNWYKHPVYLTEWFVFFTVILIIRIFMIIYNVLQHYYDKWCSHENWSSLLMPPLAENSWKQRSCSTWEDTTKHWVKFSSFETSIYRVFWWIVEALKLRARPIWDLWGRFRFSY